jgi:hypothetical protein
VPKFSVRVESDAPWDTRKALDGAGIPSIGPASAGFTESPESWITSNDVTAVVEADSPEAAVARVREVIGGEVQVGPASVYGD